MALSKHKKGLRIALYSFVTLLVLTGAGLFILSKYLPGIVRNKINSLVVTGSDSLYKCSIENISIDIWRSNASIENVNISVDSVKYKKLKKLGKLPNITFELKMLKGSILGLKIFPLIFSKKITIETVQVDNANITLCRQHDDKKKPAPTEESVWKSIEPQIKGIYINNIWLNKIKLAYRHSEDKKEIDFAYQDCSMKLRHIRLDSLGASDPTRILFTEDIAIKMAGINYFTKDSLYHLRVDSISYSSRSKVVELNNFSFNPTRTPIEFTRRHGMQVDIFEATIPKLTGFNFKIDRIFTHNEVCFDTIVLNQPIVKINRDRTAHFDTTSQLGKYPNEALANAPFTIRIPLVILNQAEIHYVERQKLSLKMGDAFFTKVTGTISNITNNKEDIEKENHCKFNLHGFFLKHAKLHVQLNFDLASSDGSYSGRSDMGSVSTDELNTVFVPFANIHIKTMSMHQSHMQFQANSKGITGTARLIYDDLKIDILKSNPKTHVTKKQGFVSLIASIVAVRAHNREGKKEVIAQHIHVIRKRRQPFANLIWEFLFESLKKIILKVPTPSLKVEM